MAPNVHLVYGGLRWLKFSAILGGAPFCKMFNSGNCQLVVGLSTNYYEFLIYSLHNLWRHTRYENSLNSFMQFIWYRYFPHFPSFSSGQDGIRFYSKVIVVDFSFSTVFPCFIYRISSYSFRGNYSFLNLTLCTVTLGHSTYRCGNYSREETIQGRKLYEEIRYIEKYH